MLLQQKCNYYATMFMLYICYSHHYPNILEFEEICKIIEPILILIIETQMYDPTLITSTSVLMCWKTLKNNNINKSRPSGDESKPLTDRSICIIHFDSSVPEKTAALCSCHKSFMRKTFWLPYDFHTAIRVAGELWRTRRAGPHVLLH